MHYCICMSVRHKKSLVLNTYGALFVNLNHWVDLSEFLCTYIYTCSDFMPFV